ncbi:hypothetical protein TorRG33x02_285400 [Trema orientale]|uniref:Uncharacterized protein n=1 Tax=Trema orientale TaxID=63057 RepID=A0A2P5CGM5_TREOI|nr:hypothetical protein TorRG33x02_285400 [Trema orientale]
MSFEAVAETATTTSESPPCICIHVIIRVYTDATFTNAGELEDFIAALLDPNVDIIIDSWLPDSMWDYTALLYQLQKKLEEDLARWKREDYIFSHLRKLFLEGHDHDDQNSTQRTLNYEDKLKRAFEMDDIYKEHCGLLCMHGDSKYGLIYEEMCGVGVTTEQLTAALLTTLEDPYCPKARRLTESDRSMDNASLLKAIDMWTT